MLQQDAVIQVLVPPLDLAMRFRMERSVAKLAHGLRLDVFRELGNAFLTAQLSTAVITAQAL